MVPEQHVLCEERLAGEQERDLKPEYGRHGGRSSASTYPDSTATECLISRSYNNQLSAESGK